MISFDLSYTASQKIENEAPPTQSQIEALHKHYGKLMTIPPSQVQVHKNPVQSKYSIGSESSGDIHPLFIHFVLVKKVKDLPPSHPVVERFEIHL